MNRVILSLSFLSLFLAPVICVGGDYLGNLSSNPYDADSTSNPYGAGSPYNPDSPNNPYGSGLIIIDD